ncbi:MAG: flagellar hook-basal body protein FliE [Alphaproteobacteria bacterium]|nr:flagellar hook-basal body protein FliE [Alphaproteobacteria bacterium]
MADMRIGTGLALSRPAQVAGGAAAGAAGAAGGKGFLDALAETAQQAIQRSKAGETAAMNGVAKTADLSEVVAAVTAAEVTLQTAVTLRDRMIQAYQDIIRMPI